MTVNTGAHQHHVALGRAADAASVDGKYFAARPADGRRVAADYL